jgi:hypothetical protein
METFSCADNRQYNRAEASWRASLQGKALLKSPGIIFAIQATTVIQIIHLPATQKYRGHIFTNPQVPGMATCTFKSSAWPPTREERHHG